MADRLTVKQRAQIACRYEVWRSPMLVQRWWQQEHNKYETLHPHTIKSCHQKLMETGSVADRPRSGRHSQTSQPITVEAVKDAFCEDASKSLRTVARELDMSVTSVRTVLKTELKWRPWKPHYVQALYPDDLDRRHEFAEKMIEWHETHPDLFDNILWSDEAIFHVGGFVNRHNSHYWSENDPLITIEKRQGQPKVTVWCGMTSSAVLGPFFIRDTMNGERYLNLLSESIYPEISAWHNFSKLQFMQDGAPPHFATTVRAWLDDKFPLRWIGRRGPLEWPARSPDLTPLDFFLWGYTKDVVYKTNPKTLHDLEEEIVNAIKNIPKEMIYDAAHSVHKRLLKCRDECGAQVEL